MRFKKIKGEDFKNITIMGEGGSDLVVDTREDGKPGLFILCDGTFLTGKQALKLAWAIIDELNPNWATKF